MAESQEVVTYDPALLQAIEEVLSSERFAPYLTASHGDHVYAVQRYLWNARVAKAFLFPLHLAEISTRNAVHRALTQRYGPGWIQTPPHGLLTLRSEEARRKAVDRLDESGKPQPTPGEIVAALTFDFWANLFRNDYDWLWSDVGLLRAAFPNLQAPYDWRYVQNRARRVNALRNRIAHHEPIWNRADLGPDHDQCLDLIGLNCRLTRDWVRRHSTVQLVLRTPPAKVPGLPGLALTAVTFEVPLEVTPEDKLLDVAETLRGRRPEAALIRGAPSVVTRSDLLTAVLQAGQALDGYVDLNTLLVRDALGPASNRLASCPATATTGDLAALFFPPGVKTRDRPTHVVVTDDLGVGVGLVERPNLRFR